MTLRGCSKLVTAAVVALMGVPVAATSSAAGAGLSAVSSSGQTAQELMTSAVRAAASETAFDTTSIAVEGTNRAEMQTDSGLTGGLQFITERFQGQTETVSVVLIGRTVYVKGNVPGLQEFMSLTPAAAHDEAGKWIRATADAKAPTAEMNFYRAAADALTVATAAPEIELDGLPSFGPETIVDGQPAREIRSTVTSNGQVAHEVLYVRAAGVPLPVQEAATGPEGHETEVFGHWGAPPVLHAPASSVPLAVSWLGSRWS